MLVPRVAAVIAIALASAGAASAQDATGGVEGRVLTFDGRAAISVRVAASSPSLQLHRAVETDARGYFRISDLPVGTYQVRLALVGYRQVRFDGVTVRLGRTTSLGETTLEAQAFELAEIVVNAERPIVDVASAATVTNLPSEQFTDIPTERNFRSIVTLAPQANASQFPDEEANISGSSGPENAYYLDGVNITDPRFGASSSNLPYNFVRELQVKAGGYEAEFGRATGGIIDVITHSGGNRFGGQVFGFFTDNGLTATPRLTLENANQGAFSDYDVGGSVGGPILRDRLWFFAAYNPSFHRQREVVQGVEAPDHQGTEHLFASKLTWQADPHTDVAVTVQGDPSRHRGVDLGYALDTVADPDAVTSLRHHGGVVLSALVRRRLGGGVQAELGLARTANKDDIEDGSGQNDPRFEDFTTGIVSGGLGHKDRVHTVRRGIRGNVVAPMGRRTVKVGVEYEDNRIDQEADGSADPGSPQGSIHREDSTTYVWYHFRGAAWYATGSSRHMARTRGAWATG